MKKMSVSTYAKLVRQIKSRVALVRSTMAENYWQIGQWIDEYLLEGKDRAKYGEHLLGNLERDIGIDRDTLTRSVQFYRLGPISATWQKLDWSKVKVLLPIESVQKREHLAKKSVQENLSVTELRKVTNPVKRKSKVTEPLIYHRGKLDLVTIEETDDGPMLDLGFEVLKKIQGDPTNVKNQVSSRNKDRFTYVAEVLKVVDGDTLYLKIKLTPQIFIKKRVRLNGIDAAPRDTPEGQKATRFVQKKLKDCPFVIVHTFKWDPYGRYLADVFYLPHEKNPHQVVQFGHFLNQELLDEGLVEMYVNK